jgi:hypothetical protein
MCIEENDKKGGFRRADVEMKNRRLYNTNKNQEGSTMSM